MNLALALLGGLVGGALTWRVARPIFDGAVFERTNYRGLALPTACGVLLAVVALGAEGVLLIADTASSEGGGWFAYGPSTSVVFSDGGGALWGGANSLIAASRSAMLTAALGFGLLGLLDDLGGAGESYGFGGHLRALRRGRATTGLVKLAGGGVVGLVVAAPFADGSVARLFLDGAMVALCANLANLFDRAPGRVVKVTVLAFVALAIATPAPDALVGPAIVVGASVALLVPDLRERMMLGDAGSNVLGAAVGVGVLLTLTPDGRVVVLVVVAALNLISERVSFSRVIDRIAPLRAFDRLGRVRADPPSAPS